MNRKRRNNRIAGGGGLRKRCDCAKSSWPKCAHPWHFNYKPKRGPNRGRHFRFNLEKVSGVALQGKIEAERAAATLRAQIDAGEFGAPKPMRDQLTLQALLDAYVKDYVTPERPRSLQNVGYQVTAIARTVVELPNGERRPFGAWLAVDVNTAAIERFRAARRTRETVTRKDADGRERSRHVGGVLTTNRNLALLRAVFNWAIRVGHLDSTPFKRATETVVKLS